VASYTKMKKENRFYLRHNKEKLFYSLAFTKRPMRADLPLSVLRFFGKRSIRRGRICSPRRHIAPTKNHIPTDPYRIIASAEFTTGEFAFPHTWARAHTHAQRMGCAATGTHATGTHECLMPADSDFHPRRESAPPTSSRFRSARPVHPICGQMGFSRSHYALTYSPR